MTFAPLMGLVPAFVAPAVRGARGGAEGEGGDDTLAPIAAYRLVAGVAESRSDRGRCGAY